MLATLTPLRHRHFTPLLIKNLPLTIPPLCTHKILPIIRHLHSINPLPRIYPLQSILYLHYPCSISLYCIYGLLERMIRTDYLLSQSTNRIAKIFCYDLSYCLLELRGIERAVKPLYFLLNPCHLLGNT